MSPRFRFFIVHLPFMRVNGMAIFPFLFIKHKFPSKVLINHERIHFRQQIELLILPFYVWYVIEYLFNRVKGQTANQAYRNISFEKEAYQHDDDLEYLKKRKIWAFLKYV